MQAWDAFCDGHGALAGFELHADHPQVCSHCLNTLSEVPQGVGHHEPVINVGLEEAPLGLSQEA